MQIDFRNWLPQASVNVAKPGLMAAGFTTISKESCVPPSHCRRARL